MPCFKDQIHAFTALPSEFQVTKSNKRTCQSQKRNELHGMPVSEIRDRQQYPSEYGINPSDDQANGNSQQP